MDRPPAMQVFFRIAEHGNFTQAAGRLNLPRATVTHALQRLEQRLAAWRAQARCPTPARGRAPWTRCTR